MWQDKRIITHPEQLTAEEMASNQGANTNRVPPEWYTWTGQKWRTAHDPENKPKKSNLFVLDENDFMTNKYQSLHMKSLRQAKDILIMR